MEILTLNESDTCELRISIDPGLLKFIHRYGINNPRFVRQPCGDIFWNLGSKTFNIAVNMLGITIDIDNLSLALHDINAINVLYRTYQSAKNGSPVTKSNPEVSRVGGVPEPTVATKQQPCIISGVVGAPDPTILDHILSADKSRIRFILRQDFYDFIKLQEESFTEDGRHNLDGHSFNFSWVQAGKYMQLTAIDIDDYNPGYAVLSRLRICLDLFRGTLEMTEY